MPLSERTERALEACHDAILAPTRWSSALQSLGKSFGAASCTFFEHDRENSPAPVPMSVGHEAFFDRWARNQAHAPDPHIGPYLQKCTSFIRAGWASALEHDLSTEEERRTLPFFHETARPEKREWLAMAFFSVDGGDWCFPIYRGDDRGRSRRKTRTPRQSRTLRRQNRRSGPEVCRVRHRLKAFSARASELRRRRPRCDRPRNPDESARAKSAWRGLQPCPGPTRGPRPCQQSPTAAAGFRLLCTRNAAALSPIRQSSSIGMKRLGFWSRRCPSRRSAAICSAPVA